MNSPDIVNTIYYVFSTIAQTLAGIIGILAALAVMRLSDFSRRLESKLPCLAHYCGQNQILFEMLIVHGDFEGAMGEVNEDEISPSDDSWILEACKTVEHRRRRLFSALQRSFLITGAVVIFSILNLIFAKQIATNLTLTWIMFSVGLAGLVACLFFIGSLVARFEAIDSQKKKINQRS